MISQAFVSGPLRQAIYLNDGRSMLMRHREPERSLPCTSNDINFFFDSEIEIKPVEPKQGNLTLLDVRKTLTKETFCHDCLDAVLSGMDRVYSEPTRRAAINLAEKLLRIKDVQSFVELRLYSCRPPQTLAPKEAAECARQIGASICGRIYRMFASDAFREIDIALDTVLANYFPPSERASMRCSLADVGMVFDLVATYLESGEESFSRRVLHWLTEEDAKTNSIPRFNRILTDLQGELACASQSVLDADIKSDAEPLGDSAPVEEPVSLDPIVELITQWRDGASLIKLPPSHDPISILDKVKSQIDWIEKELTQGRRERALRDLLNLVSNQLQASRPEDLAKTFTDLANRVCKLNDFVLALDIIGYAELLNVLDPAIFCTKAEIYRSRQYLDEALEQYDRTIEAFPQDAVARCEAHTVL